MLSQVWIGSRDASSSRAALPLRYSATRQAAARVAVPGALLLYGVRSERLLMEGLQPAVPLVRRVEGGMYRRLHQGTGTLTWAWDGNWQTTTGRMVDGKANGHAVFRFADGGVQKGPVVDGEPNGRWLLRFPDGGVEEGPLVDGERHGHWVHRSGSFIHEDPYVDGKRDGLWVTRMEGRTEEVSTLYRNGERVR